MCAVSGPFGPIQLDSNSQRLAPFRIYSVDSSTGEFVQFANISISNTCSSGVSTQSNCISLVGGVVDGYDDFVDQLPPDVPTCGFHGELCDQKGFVLHGEKVDDASLLGR